MVDHTIRYSMAENKSDDRVDGGRSPKGEAILAAAKSLFLSEPYDRVSMDAVAAAAGVSKVTIYAHFENKERLFVAAISEGCRAVFDPLALNADGEGGLQAALERMGIEFVRYITSPDVSALHGVLIQEGRSRPDLTALFYETTVRSSTRQLGHLLAEQVKAKRIVCDDPETAAVQFIAMVQGDLTYRNQLGLGAPELTAIKTYVRSCVQMFCRAHEPR